MFDNRDTLSTTGVYGSVFFVHRFYLSVMLCVGLSAGCSNAKLPTFAEAVRDTKTLPAGTLLFLLPPDEAPRIKTIVSASEDELDALLESTKSRDRSIGLFILQYHGDINRLSQYSSWLDIAEDAMPYAFGVNDDGQTNVIPLPVGRQLKGVYMRLLGSEVFTAAEFTRKFGGVQDFEYFASPWIFRLSRSDEKKQADFPLPRYGSKAELKAKIRKMKPELQGFIIVMGYIEGSYSFEEAEKALRRLPAPARERLMNDKSYAPPDPRFAPGSEDEQQVRRFAKLLITGESE